MRIEIEKIIAATEFLSKEIPNLYFTKYLKLMYYFDFISVLETGRSATKETYYRLPYGPVPSFTKDQVKLLDEKVKDFEFQVFGEEGSSIVANSIFDNVVALEEFGSGKILKAVNGNGDYNSYLSDYEKGLLSDIVKEFKDTSVKEIVEKTHSEPPFQRTNENNIVDYRLAFFLDRTKILPERDYNFNTDISLMEFCGT